MPKVEFLFLNRAEAAALAPRRGDLIRIVEKGLAAHGTGEVVQPPKSHLRLDERFNGHFNILAGYAGPVDLAGVKVIADYVDNWRHGLPSEVAMLALYDPRTGVPRCLMDATELTWLRTGAVTAIGARHLARPDSTVLAHIGVRGTVFSNVELLAPRLRRQRHHGRDLHLRSRAPGRPRTVAHAVGGRRGGIEAARRPVAQPAARIRDVSGRGRPDGVCCDRYGGSRLSRDRRPDRASSHGWRAAPRTCGSGGVDMAIGDHIRNPLEWGWDQLRLANLAAGRAGRALRGAEEAALPSVRRIEMADLRDALARGVADFAACRTDVVFLCVVYPVVGLVLARVAFGQELLPLLFPLASGFALVGPVAAVGLYEMSRRREQGHAIGWADAFGVVRSPAFGAILVLGLLLLAIFLIWLLAAYGIYAVTLGPAPPASAGAFIRDVFTTAAGWAMIVLGVGVGFLFALLVLTIGVVSFPLLLDRDVGIYAAISTSVRAVAANPGPMAVWGLIVAAGLIVGSIPVFLGLIVVMPVLGHATWHLYRKVVSR